MLSTAFLSACTTPPPRVKASVPMVSHSDTLGRESAFREEGERKDTPSISQNNESLEVISHYTSASQHECVIAKRADENNKSNFCWKQNKWVELKALN